MPHVKTQDRIATLDLLRLVAALAVVAFHYLFRGAAADGYLIAGYPEAAPFALYGYLGVNLFFLISGFVIAWSAEGRDWQTFAVARFARIYPGFIACMTLTWIVLVLAGHPALAVTVPQYAANLFVFAPALKQPFVDGVYWSIALELVFYGWVALALLAGVFSRLQLSLVAGWLVICALNEFLIGSGALRLVFLTEFGPLFAAGILVHHIVSHGRSAEALLLLAAAFLLSCNTMTNMQAWMQDHYGISVPLIGLVLSNIAMHGMLIGAVALRHRIAPSPAILMIGGLTYPLYLLHQNMGYVMINALSANSGRWLAAAATLVVMLLLSWAVWRFVERPLRRPLIGLLSPVVGRVADFFHRKRAPAE